MTRGPHAPVAPRITDHALIRFLDRSGVNVEAVRRAMADALAGAHGAALAIGGGDHLIVVDGMTFVVRAGSVATVLVDNGLHDRAHMLDTRARS